MKFLILLCSLSFFGSAAIAQSMNVVSTSPANGDFAVDSDSIVITFDQKVDFSIFFGDTTEPDFFFFLTPEDSLEYTGVSLSNDSLSIIYYVDLAENTDFLGFVVNAVGIEGETLAEPYLFQFTTAPTAGAFVVEGSLPQPILEKALVEHPYDDIILVLSEAPFDFGFNNDECNDEECEEDEGLRPLHAAFVNPVTGTYRISSVREGEYYPVGLDFFGDNFEEEDDEFFIPEIYFYDTDDNLIPNSIVVNSTTAPNDTLSGIDLRALEIIPISFSDALVIAQPILDELDNDPVVVGGTTFYASIDFFDDDEEDSVVFESSLLKNMISRIPSAEASENSEEDFLEIISTPSGFQLEWTIFGYDAIKDSAFTIITTPFGAQFAGYMSEEEAELPEGVSFSDIKLLPETFIDSDSAATIIEENGGLEFRNEFMGETSFWQSDLQAVNNFWDLNEDTTLVDAPVMWSSEYFGYSFDDDSGEYTEGYFVIYLDIQTGAIIYSKTEFGGLNEEAQITFREALELAEEAISELDNNPVIVGGGTRYFSTSDLNEGEDEPDLSTQLLNKIISLHEDDGPDNILDLFSDPNGENIIWEVYGYDAVKDSAFSLSVSLLSTDFNGYIGPEEAEFPDSVGFGDLELLPSEFIDSDSAATIVEENGGWEFRDYFSGEYDFWEMELTALDNFWELAEDTIITNSSVMWTAEYYGFSYDPLSNFFEEGYFIIYIDIETGEILYSYSDISDGPSTSHITFDEAVNIANSTTEDFLLDKDIMGGITRYTNAPVIFKGAKNEVPKSYQKMVTSAILDHPESVQPDGNAYSWEIFVYDKEEDSVIVLNVSEFDVFISEKFSDADLEDGVDFDDMLPLPFTYIDSDSAALLIDDQGAHNFRTSKEDAELDWYWESELQLLHQYWDYPLDMTPSAPITWRAEYYAWAFDSETQELLEDSLTIYLDAETGGLLFSSILVSIDDEPEAPEEFRLSQNYPNPFNPSTNIPFTLSEASKVEISVYSILGQKVATIANGLFPVGSHNIQWDARNLASGVYIYRMQAGSFIQTKKMILLK